MAACASSGLAHTSTSSRSSRCTNLGRLSGGLGITGAANEESGKQYEKWKADQAAKFLA